LRVGAVLGAVMAALAFWPLPYSTIAQGVIGVPGEGAILAETDGTVAALSVAQGAAVLEGDPILVVEDPLVDARVAILQSTVSELNRRVDAAIATDPNATRIAREELAAAQADLALALERRDALTVHAGTAGTVVLQNHTDLVGRFVRKGDPLGYVTTFRDPVIRAVVAERDADLVLGRTRALEVRFVTDLETVLPARAVRQVPALSGSLPSLALATQGGGLIVTDPGSRLGARALDNLLHLEVATAPGTPFATIGARVYLRFVHDPEPIAARVGRRLRQVFLDRFGL